MLEIFGVQPLEVAAVEQLDPVAGRTDAPRCWGFDLREARTTSSEQQRQPSSASFAVRIMSPNVLSEP